MTFEDSWYSWHWLFFAMEVELHESATYLMCNHLFFYVRAGPLMAIVLVVFDEFDKCEVGPSSLICSAIWIEF